MTLARLERRVMGYVARYLTSTPRLEQFIARLLQRWRDNGGEVIVSSEDIATLVEKCVRCGYIDDQRFAELRIRRWYRAGQPQWVIRQKLRAEMLDEDIIAEALNAFMQEQPDNSENLDDEAAMHYVRKRLLGGYRIKNRLEQREKDIAKLRRRGFSYETARKAIDQDIDLA